MGPFGLVGVSTTSLEGAHLVVVDLVVHLVAQRVGNFSDRPWGISVILVIVATLTGPGKVWLQSMSITQLAVEIADHLPGSDSSSSASNVGGLIGGLLKG